MRKPKVENKYNLTMKKINKLSVGDESKIKEPLFWRNNVINAWCISGTVGTDKDIQYGTDNEFWIGIYDKPYYNSRIRVYCNCLGGMSTYKFNKFFRSEDIEHENDLKVQEDLLKTVNNLIDEGILVMEDGQRLRNLYFGEIMLSMHGVLVERLGLIKIYSTALITSFG